jgi:SAM-dependent methyltransferase
MDTDAVWVEDMPAGYDRLLGPALFAPFARELAGRAVPLEPARVLEVAAGTGIVTRELHAALPGARLLATDLNPAMAARGATGVPQVPWAVADAMALPLPDSSIDLVVCSFGAMFFPDRPIAFAETARVLAPGGTALFTVWDVVDRSTLPAALHRAVAAAVPDDPPDFVARVPHGYADPARISADVAAGGLTAQLETVQLVGGTPSVRELAEGFVRGTPLRAALGRHGELTDMARAVADRMADALGEGPVTGELTAHLVTARHA